MSEAALNNGPKLPYGFARREGVLAYIQDGEPVLSRRPGATLDALVEARRALGLPAAITDISAQEFESTAARLYAEQDLSGSVADAMDMPDDLNALADGLPRTSDLLDSQDDAPVIRLINGLLQEAIRTRASDIHIEPFESRLLVRYRIDGALRDMLSLSERLAPLLVSRVKVMAKLDIAKKRVPQDGRFSLNLGQRAVDVRVSTLPSHHGERAVLRILEKDSGRLELSELGMAPSELEAFRLGLAKPNGIILVTGPTGAGKTTTLYAALTGLNDGSRNVLTVEDPVEYALDGIGQTQVNNQTGMTFAAGLRAILRQDPDVVMVGEIRDPETAQIAVQAALTGHLVLSTLHTNSSIAAMTRLRDMGVESFLLASTVTAIVAQRLVRRLCPDCKTPYTPSAREVSDLGLRSAAGQTFYKAVGCDACLNIGYLGRLGLYEIASVDDALRSLIHEGASEDKMRAHVFAGGGTLLDSGREHVLAGRTSIEEVLRVCRHGEGGDI